MTPDNPIWRIRLEPPSLPPEGIRVSVPPRNRPVQTVRCAKDAQGVIAEWVSPVALAIIAVARNNRPVAVAAVLDSTATLMATNRDLVRRFLRRRNANHGYLFWGEPDWRTATGDLIWAAGSTTGSTTG